MDARVLWVVLICVGWGVDAVVVGVAVVAERLVAVPCAAVRRNDCTNLDRSEMRVQPIERRDGFANRVGVVTANADAADAAVTARVCVCVSVVFYRPLCCCC